MGYIYINNEGKLTDKDPYPLCIESKTHTYLFFKEEDKTSDFEEICKCGSARINTKGFYSFKGFEMYQKDGFINFRNESLRLRNESGLVKKVEETSLFMGFRQLYKSLFSH